MRIRRRNDKDQLRGVVAGAVGGLVASWVMNQFQALWGSAMYGIERSHGAQSLQRGSPRHGVARELEKRGSDRESDNAAVRAASVISEKVFGHKLAESEKEMAGAIAHYAMGVTSGGIYGAMAGFAPATTVGAVLPFGAAVWLLADEVVAPALGLSKPATEYPPETHAYAITSHLVFGLTTEMVRRALR